MKPRASTAAKSTGKPVALASVNPACFLIMFTLFYIGLAVVALGLGTVGWLLYTDHNNDQKNSSTVVPSANLSPKIRETTAQLLNRVGLGDENHAKESPQGDKRKIFLTTFFNSLPFLKKPSEEVVETFEPSALSTPKAAATPIHQPSSVNDAAIGQIAPIKEANTDFQAWQSTQFKEKLDKLEALLNEKNQTLEKAERELASELKNRKEFNKVKDALEKELKDSRVRARDLQIELTSTQTESAGFKNRVNQLELKVTNLQKTVTELEHSIHDKDEKIQDLTKKLQTSAEALKVISETKSRSSPAPIQEVSQQSIAMSPEAIRPQINEPPVAEPTPPESADEASKGEASTSIISKESASQSPIETPSASQANTESSVAESLNEEKGPTRQESLKHFLKHLEEPQPAAASDAIQDSKTPAEDSLNVVAENTQDSKTPIEGYIKLPPDILENKTDENSTAPAQDLPTKKQKTKSQETDSNTSDRKPDS